MLRKAISTALLIGVSPFVFAQSALPPSVEAIPPLGMPAPSLELPNGTAVSQPLRPVLVEPHLPAIPTQQPKTPNTPNMVERVLEPLPVLPFAKSWDSMELLQWWTKPSNLPPLVATNATRLPTLSTPNTLLLFGGGRGDPPGAGGGRFKMGWAVGAGNQAGFEVGYQFLGTRSNTDSFRNYGSSREALLGIPLRNANTGAEDVVLLGGFGQTARFDVIQSGRVQGWTATGLGNLYNGTSLKVHALAGYRYLMLNEGVRLDLRSSLVSTGLVHPTINTMPGTAQPTVSLRSASADQFDAHNRFHGAQVGFRTEFEHQGFFAEVDTKMSLGRTVEVVKVSGQTVAVADTPGGPTVSYFPSGVFGQPTNSGRVSRSSFAFLPEADLKVGFRFGERSRFFVGYNFLYLNHAVRASEQFDRTVDLTQTMNTNDIRVPSTRPLLPMDRSDIWLQGLSLGLEWRY
jgi:hypothetical protein